jgi:hypothetical protein
MELNPGRLMGSQSINSRTTGAWLIGVQRSPICGSPSGTVTYPLFMFNLFNGAGSALGSTISATLCPVQRRMEKSLKKQGSHWASVALGIPGLHSKRQNVGEEAIDLDEQGKNKAGKQDKCHRSSGEKLGEISHRCLSKVEQIELESQAQRGEMGTAASGS